MEEINLQEKTDITAGEGENCNTPHRVLYKCPECGYFLHTAATEDSLFFCDACDKERVFMRIS